MTQEVDFKSIVESNAKSMREQATVLNTRASVLEEVLQLFVQNGWKVVAEVEEAPAPVVEEESK